MIDFHSHIIPNLDDGASSVEMSLEMLASSAKQGVTDVVSTSHCEPHRPETIDRFVANREKKLEILLNSLESYDKPLPNIHLACEVSLVTDISNFDNLHELCLSNTDYIMIEMPYDPWKDWVFDSIYTLTLNGYKPIIAHIDRFMDQKDNALSTLFELDVVYQINTDILLSKKYVKIADELLSKGHAHILGTDMHNTTKRVPNMEKAKEIIIKRYGEACLTYFEENSKRILCNQHIKHRRFNIPEKESIFKKILRK